MALVAAVAVTGASIALTAYVILYQGMADVSRRQMALTAEHVCRGVAYRFHDKRDILSGMAESDLAEAFVTKHQYLLLVEAYDRVSDSFTALRFVDATGLLLFNLGDGAGADGAPFEARDRTVTQAMAEPGRIFWEVVAAKMGPSLVRMSIGVKDYFDVMHGVFSVDARIPDITEDLGLQIGGEITALLLDRRGNVLSAPASQGALLRLPVDGDMPPWLTNGLERSEPGFGSIGLWGMEHYLCIHPVAGTDWHVATIQAVTAAEKQWRDIRLVVLATSVAILLLAATVSWPLARRISAPLSSLARAADAMAEGEFPSHLPEGARSEIGRLTGSFNRMVDKVQASRRALEQSRDDLDERVRNRTANLLREIDERKKYERALGKAKELAEAASHAKTEFLANMSHEIRTPLNGILGMLQFIQMSDLDEQQEEDVVMAVQSCLRLNALLGDILDLSRIEAGRMILAAREFGPGDVLDSVRDLFRLNCEQMGLDLAVRCDEDVPRMVVGDEQRLRQILVNLAGNAVKFTAKGGVTVRAENLSSVRAGQCRLLFSVEDTGKGIPDDRLEELFEPFTQLEGEYTRKAEGAGLGLGIVRRLVILMGGSMSVSSEVGRGTCIYLSLSFGEAQGQDLSASDREVGSADFHGHGLTVLLVEDDAVNKVAVSGMLGRLGLEVRVASDGVQALDMLAAGGIDFIVMDVQLPSMDGLEATRRIRTDPALAAFARIPIIAMTAHSLESDRERFLQGGMDHYVSKPVAMEALSRVIAQALASREGNQGPA